MKREIVAFGVILLVIFLTLTPSIYADEDITQLSDSNYSIIGSVSSTNLFRKLSDDEWKDLRGVEKKYHSLYDSIAVAMRKRLDSMKVLE